MIVWGNRFFFFPFLLPFIVAAKGEGGKIPWGGALRRKRGKKFLICAMLQWPDPAYPPLLPWRNYFVQFDLRHDRYFPLLFFFLFSVLRRLKLRDREVTFFPLVIVRRFVHTGKLHDLNLFQLSFRSFFILRPFLSSAKVLQAFRKVSLAHFSSLISCPQAQRWQQHGGHFTTLCILIFSLSPFHPRPMMLWMAGVRWGSVKKVWNAFCGGQGIS